MDQKLWWHNKDICFLKRQNKLKFKVVSSIKSFKRWKSLWGEGAYAAEKINEIQVPPLHSLFHTEAKPASLHLFSGSVITLPFIHLQIPEAWHHSQCLPQFFPLFNHMSNCWLYFWNSSRILPSPLLTQLWPRLVLQEMHSFTTLRLLALFCRISRINCKWTVELTEVYVTPSQKINYDNAIGKKTCHICPIPIRCPSISKSYTCLAI